MAEGSGVPVPSLLTSPQKKKAKIEESEPLVALEKKVQQSSNASGVATSTATDLHHICIFCKNELLPGKLKHEQLYSLRDSPDEKYHPSCYSGKKLRTLSKTTAQVDQDISGNERPILIPFTGIPTCLFCGRNSLPGKRKHEKLISVSGKWDERRLAALGTINSSSAVYHRSCKSASKIKTASGAGEGREQPAESVYDTAFNELVSEIREPIMAGQVYKVSTLRDQYIRRLSDAGLQEDIAKQYRSDNLKKRLITEFGKNIDFLGECGSSDVLYASHLPAKYFLRQWISLKDDVDENYVEVTDEQSEPTISTVPIDESRRQFDILKMSTDKIKSEARELKNRQNKGSWNLNNDEALSSIPVALYNMIALLISDTAKHEHRDKDGRLVVEDKRIGKMTTKDRVSHISQTVMYNMTNVKTPLQTTLAVYVYSKTRSEITITALNRHGLCISYTDLKRLLNTASKQIDLQTISRGLFIPMNIQPNKFVHFSIDNLDFSENTLKGETSHVTSMIVMQPNHPSSSDSINPMDSFGNQPMRYVRNGYVKPTPTYEQHAPIEKLKRNMQIHDASLGSLIEKRHTYTFPNLNLCWALGRHAPTKLMDISVEFPSWKSMNRKIGRQTTPITTIGYCPFIRKPPTDPGVVKQALQLCMKMNQSLGNKHTVVSQDEAVYEISYTLRKKCPLEYENLILRLGGFHLLMNYYGAVGRMMGSAGLQELLGKSGVVQPGTAAKLMIGKSYYQTVRAHLAVFETLTSLKWAEFECWAIERNSEFNIFDVNIAMEELSDAIKAGSTDCYQLIEDLNDRSSVIVEQLRLFDEARSDYQTHQLWSQYLRMIDVSLSYIRAERLQNWKDHLSATSDMASVVAANGHTKYSKAVLCYLHEMRQLPTTAPEIEEEFERGGFSVRRSHTPGTGIWSDMALECSLNVDAKGRYGSVGLKGISGSEHTTERWITSLPFTATLSASLKKSIHMDEGSQEPTTSKDKDICYKMKKVFEDGVCTNPFTYDKPHMINISTGVVANPEVAKDLLHATTKGTNVLTRCTKGETISKMKIKTFDSQKMVKQNKAKLKTREATEEVAILKRVLLKTSDSDRGDTTVENLMTYELSQHPPAIAEISTTTGETVLRSGTKSSLVTILKNKTDITFSEDIPERTTTTGVVIDAMAYVRSHPPFDTEVCHKYATRLISGIVKSVVCSQIHIVSDRYDGRDQNGITVDLKEASGCRDRRDKSGTEYAVLQDKPISNWKAILQNNKSKSNFLECIFQTMSNSKHLLPGDLTLTLAGGFADRRKVVEIGGASKDGITLPHLASSQEEADTRLFLHVRDCVRKGCNRVLIFATDTDVVVIAIYVYEQLRSEGLNELYIRYTDIWIPVHDLAHKLTSDEAGMLPFIHGISGCDTISYFFGKGKARFMKQAWEMATELRRVSDVLSNGCDLSEQNIKDIVDTSTELVCKVYGSKELTLNDTRSKMYTEKSSLNVMPPTDDSFRLHALRAIVQTTIWVKCFEQYPEIPDVLVHGWTLHPDEGVRPVFSTRDAYPRSLQKTPYCNCKNNCVSKCSCASGNFKCAAECQCQCVVLTSCSPDDDSDTESDSDVDDDEDCSLYEHCSLIL